jgi:DNA-binding CsgD family transcriptional regulator
MKIKSQRQYQILDLVAKGHSKRQVIIELNISGSVVTNELKKLRDMNDALNTNHLCFMYGVYQGENGR